MSHPAQHNPAGRGFRLLLGALGLLLFADLAADSVARLAGQPVVAWMGGLEVFAVLALAVAVAVLMWQSRTGSSARRTADAPSARRGRVTDGGDGVREQSDGAAARQRPAAPPVQDGGAFRAP